MVGIDLMQLKPYKGYHYVISAVDYFTKYVKMGVLKTKSAEEVQHGYSTICFADTTS